MASPAGWYIQEDGRERFWDGAAWTEQVRNQPQLSPTSSLAPAPATTAPSPVAKKKSKKHLILYPLTALIALGIGAASAGGSKAPASAGSTVTATASTPGTTVTATVPVPGPTRTVVSPKPAVTVTVKVTPQPVKAFAGDGLYQVGVDIQPGTYRSPASGGNCYWARLKSNTTSDIIDNANTTGQTVVTINPSDKFFDSSGCGDWTKG